jgi:hypothetical protein
MTKKFKLLLLDANVVIKAFELGLWQQLIDRRDIWIAGTVIQEAESQNYAGNLELVSFICLNIRRKQGTILIKTDLCVSCRKVIHRHRMLFFLPQGSQSQRCTQCCIFRVSPRPL